MRFYYVNCFEGITLAAKLDTMFDRLTGPAPEMFVFQQNDKEIYVVKKLVSLDDIIDDPMFIYIFHGKAKEMEDVRNRIQCTSIKVFVEEYIDDPDFHEIAVPESKRILEKSNQKSPVTHHKTRQRKFISKIIWTIPAMLFLLVGIWLVIGTFKNNKHFSVYEASITTMDSVAIENRIKELLENEDIHTSYLKKEFETLVKEICIYLLTTHLDLPIEECGFLL